MLYSVGVLQLEKIYDKLKESFQIVSPTFQDGVIIYKEGVDFHSLPFGYENFEAPSFYQAVKNSDRYFSYLRPSNSPKYFLRPPTIRLFTVKKSDGTLSFEYDIPSKKIAIFDVRRCDLKAIQILDKVYLNQKFPDPYYKALRDNLFLVGVECFKASDVCFCSSMGVDVEEDYGADIFISELDGKFILKVCSERAKEVLEGIKLEEASGEELSRLKEKREQFLRTFRKSLNTDRLKESLYDKIEHPYWEEIGRRCLSCTNCTQVCPTCFCFDIKEVNSLDLQVSQRVVSWDSCFNQTFATVHKFNIRDSIGSRYRQWLMHKMAYWQDQFGEFGCVGCGRCITWCPAKIDIQIESSKLREL